MKYVECYVTENGNFHIWVESPNSYPATCLIDSRGTFIRQTTEGEWSWAEDNLIKAILVNPPLEISFKGVQWDDPTTWPQWEWQLCNEKTLFTNQYGDFAVIEGQPLDEEPPLNDLDYLSDNGILHVALGPNGNTLWMENTYNTWYLHQTLEQAVKQRPETNKILLNGEHDCSDLFYTDEMFMENDHCRYGRFLLTDDLKEYIQTHKH